MHMRCRRTAARSRCRGTAARSAARTSAIPAVVATVIVASTAAPAAGRSPAADTQCYIRIQGSAATATCHNPDPDQVRMRLHIRCARWWDPSVDSAPSTVGPAQTVVLTDRCWKEIGAVWVTLAP